MTPLRDQPDRDRFATDLDRNFCVSAGAGVGKTTAIVRRIAALAEVQPEALPRLVVVTYAKAAAEELRVRARASLLQGGADGALGHLLPLFRQAFFGTIHSFCLKLVRDYGRALGISPAADLLEPGDEDEAWARYCESPLLDAVPLEPALLREVSRFLSFDELLKLARKISMDQAARIVAAFQDEPKPAVDFTEALADSGKRSPEKTRNNQALLRRFLADLAAEAPFLKLPEVAQGSGTFLAAYQTEMFPLASWLGRAAALLAARISLGFRDYRRTQEVMTYADQIAWCRQLLEHPGILQELRERDWIILLDEAQDTDATMFSILAELARPPGAAPGSWPAQAAAPAPRPGRLCFVGDEQQAIYSGRSNLATYRKYIDAYDAGRGGERLEFSVTMRCPQRVIGVVNSIFFHQDRLRQTHFSFRELHPPPRCEEGAAWLLPIQPLDAEKPKVDEAFESECRQVAAFLGEYGPEGLGVSKWNDVAILCPRNTWLRMAADVFIDAGLPCRLVSQKRLQLELPERSWPAALFYVLLNPWDRFELLGLLRELFAISDIDLADAHAVNDPFTFLSEAGLSEPLSAALQLLRGLHRSAPGLGVASLGEWVGEVLKVTHMTARLEAIGQRTEAIQQLRHEALCAEMAGQPARQWVGQLVRNLRRPAPHLSGLEDEIPLLTSYSAKGLEWPVVIPLGLGRSIGERTMDFPRLEESEEGVTVHLSKVTAEQEERKELLKQARREELQRVFYVTLTRAKSLLILPDTLRLYKKSDINFLSLSQWEELEHQHLFEPPPLRPSITPPIFAASALPGSPRSRD